MLFRPSQRPRYRVQPVTACNSLILLQDWELAFVVFALSRQQPCWLLRCAMTSMPPAPSIRPALPPFVLTSPLLLPPAALHYDFKVPALSLEPATTARGLRLLNGQHLLNSASATAQSVRMCSPPQTMCAPPTSYGPFLTTTPTQPRFLRRRVPETPLLKLPEAVVASPSSCIDLDVATMSRADTSPIHIAHGPKTNQREQHALR